MHTYEACLKTLEHADYFILLIGSRVGGWYDKENKISITQQEYRAAYQRHLKGKLKIISFVRNDVWQYREDRNELSRFLEKQAIDPGAKHDIVNHPSKWANDSEFICRFISEVCKNEETKKALKDPSQQMPLIYLIIQPTSTPAASHRQRRPLGSRRPACHLHHLAP